jgi:two-component system response regulator FixJ
VEGHPNKIIAYKLGLSVRTVELYRAGLMDRLEVDSVADVLKIAFAANLISA